MFYQWQEDSLILNCRIQPGSNHDEFAGVLDNMLKVRITAAPEKGKANQHLVTFLARQFKTRQADIEIIKGQGSRMKSIRIRRPGVIPAGLNIPDRPQP